MRKILDNFVSTFKVIILTGVLFSVNLSVVSAKSEDQGKLILEISGFRNDDGQGLAAIIVYPEDFPKSRRALKKAKFQIINGKAHVEWDNVPYGTYAIAMFHDENGNLEFDRSYFLGLPKEGYGYSRDAKPRNGPPSFEQAKFDFKEKEKILTIHVQYLF
jgi:uncharacterized protein (DUF2141 family)